MESQWTIKPEYFHAAVVGTVGVGVVTAAALLTSMWWRGRRKIPGSRGIRKSLVCSPGVRIVHLKEESSSSAEKSQNGWRLFSAKQGGDAECATKWEQSKQKGNMGYYFAHHTSLKELAPEDYQMNGPRLLSKGALRSKEGGENGVGNGSPTVTAPAPQQRRAQAITSYSWEDCEEEVRLTFRQSGWEWGKVEEGEIAVEWQARLFRMSIDSREYGLHKMELHGLYGEVAGVRVRKMRSKLVVALVKGGRGSYRKAPWEALHAKREESDSREPMLD